MECVIVYWYFCLLISKELNRHWRPAKGQYFSQDFFACYKKSWNILLIKLKFCANKPFRSGHWNCSNLDYQLEPVTQLMSLFLCLSVYCSNCLHVGLKFVTFENIFTFMGFWKPVEGCRLASSIEDHRERGRSLLFTWLCKLIIFVNYSFLCNTSQ